LQSLIHSNDIHDELIKVKNHLEGQGFDAAAKAISNRT
jgi:hypothetical protein